MKILLITCPFLVNTRPPISLAYIKSSLYRDKRADIKCLDFNLDFFEKSKSLEISTANAIIKNKKYMHYKGIRPLLPIDTKMKEYFIELWLKQIKKYDPDILGISIYDSTKIFSVNLAKKVKAWKRRIIIIFGGPDCIFNGEKYLLNKYADIVALGEGEETFPELIKTIINKDNLDSVKGIIYRKKSGIIIKTKVREEIPNIDSIKFPDYSDFNISKYKYYNKVTLPILGSRGCINRCKFCNHTYFWKRCRFRSADNIFKEIKNNIKKYKVRNFIFHDSYFGGNLTETQNLYDLIIKNNLEISWEATTGFNKKMDYELIKKMKNAGCMRLNFGLESGSQKILNDMGKNFILKDAKKIIKYCNKCGVTVNLYLLAGYPTETNKDFSKTLNFIKKNRFFIDEVTIGTGCSISPGSYLFKNLSEFKIKYVNYMDWSNKLITPKIRLIRIRTLKRLVEKLGLKCMNYSESILENLVNNNIT
jgi:radical SAM superfamily enzyme YgiQ (UPF0313 family)